MRGGGDNVREGGKQKGIREKVRGGGGEETM